MTKVRLKFFLTTFGVVFFLVLLASFYVRGYRLDNRFKLSVSGLLVANSVPKGASVIINGELKTATNSTIKLSPGTYDLAIRKEGYSLWNKRIVIEKEVVTQIEAVLFPVAPSLSALTSRGVGNPKISPDLTKIAYEVPLSKDGQEGLWIIEILNLPLGFTGGPRQITDGNLEGASWEFSPDGREILLSLKTASYLLDTSTFTPQGKRVNVSSRRKEIELEWEKEKNKKLESKLSSLPEAIAEIFSKKVLDIAFSPDETKILYSASSEARIPQGLIKPLPGASTQRQTRDIKIGKKYVYDIKEDRNFEVEDSSITVYWFPTSAHLLVAEPDKISIMDYDGANKQIVYSGSYLSPYAFPSLNFERLIILTNLGANSSPPNLYSLSLK